MRIAFTGAHSTGKSTLVHEIASLAVRLGMARPVVVDGIARAVLSRGIPVNRSSTLDTYLAIISTYLDRELALTGNVALFDRFLPDHAAYARVHGNCPAELLKIMRTCHEMIVRSKGYDRVFFLPITFPVVPDGARDPDPLYQRAVSEEIRAVLHEWNQPYQELTGTVQQRVDVILSSLGWEV